jgi:hypothetical protein
MATKGTEVLGFSVGRLSQLRDRLQTGVNQGEIPGAVALVVRREEIACFEAVGYRDREAGARMEHDAIFRIASLTKPLTSLAAMMLVEEAKLSLSTPVSEYLPVLKGLQVGHQRSDGVLDLEPCRREVTILDLFRHTSGFTYGWIGNSAVKKQYQAAGIDQFVGSAGDYLKATRGAATAIPAGHNVGIRCFDRRAWARSRDGVGHDARRIYHLADHRAVGNGRYRVLGRPVEAAPHRRAADRSGDGQASAAARSRETPAAIRRRWGNGFDGR